jgi:NAD(P)H-dependent FMN reductase
MSISKNNSHSEKLELLGERYLGECLVGEDELHEYIRTLHIPDWESFAASMQVVVDVTGALIENETDEIDDSALQLIEQVARESEDKSYQRIMEAIVAAIEQGGEGIRSAYKTAAVAVDMVFIWTPEYFSALKQYAGKLRRKKSSSRKKA